MKKENLLGRKFGRLVAIKEHESKIQPSGQKKTMWLCECECGNKVIVSSYNLKKKTKSCGCLQKEIFSQINKKHGMHGTRLYRIWNNMKNRCYNKNIKAYKDYGNRGIKVCAEWLDKKNGFKNFYNWAINNKYKEDLTIDRINVNGNYEPSNCRFIRKEEQAHNKRNSIMITYKGKTEHITYWAKLYNVSRDCLWQRIKVLNWDIEKSLLTPNKKRKT